MEEIKEKLENLLNLEQLIEPDGYRCKELEIILNKINKL